MPGLTFYRAQSQCQPRLDPLPFPRSGWEEVLEGQSRAQDLWKEGKEVLLLEVGQICRGTDFFRLCASEYQTRCRKTNSSESIASPRPPAPNLYFCSNQAQKLYRTKFCFCWANGQQAQRTASCSVQKILATLLIMLPHSTNCFWVDCLPSALLFYCPYLPCSHKRALALCLLLSADLALPFIYSLINQKFCIY